MARLPQTGSAVASLYERSPELDELVARRLIDPRECITTLADVISGLGLAALSPYDEQKVRGHLGIIIGRGLQELESSPAHNPDAKLQVSDLQKTLRLVARGLTKMARGQLVAPAAMAIIDKTLRGRETGLHHVHHLAAANEIMVSLTPMVGDRARPTT